MCISGCRLKYACGMFVDGRPCCLAASNETRNVFVCVCVCVRSADERQMHTSVCLVIVMLRPLMLVLLQPDTHYLANKLKPELHEKCAQI